MNNATRPFMAKVTMANGRNLHLDDLASSPKKLQHAKPNVSLTIKIVGVEKEKTLLVHPFWIMQTIKGVVF